MRARLRTRSSATSLSTLPASPSAAVPRLDLEAHVPQIASFWETILLGARSYGGGAFRPHAELHLKSPLRAGHFERWLALWRATVDDLFAGERADLAKAHAERVARAFHARLQSMPSAAGGDRGAGGLLVTQHRAAAREGR